MLGQYLRIATALILGLLINFSVLARDNNDSDNGNGKTRKETRTVLNFKNIEIDGASETNIVQGDEESLEIKADEKTLPLIKSEVKNGTLYLGLKDKSIRGKPDIKYNISVKYLENVRFSGANEVTFKGKIKGATLNLTAMGENKIEIKDLRVEKFTLNTEGGNKVEAEGEATEQMITMNGAGKFDGEDLKGNVGTININGAGNAKINVADKLDVNIAGAGKVEYYRNPQITQKVSGNGEIKAAD